MLLKLKKNNKYPVYAYWNRSVIVRVERDTRISEGFIKDVFSRRKHFICILLLAWPGHWWILELRSIVRSSAIFGMHLTPHGSIVEMTYARASLHANISHGSGRGGARIERQKKKKKQNGYYSASFAILITIKLTVERVNRFRLGAIDKFTNVLLCGTEAWSMTDSTCKKQQAFWDVDIRQEKNAESFKGGCVKPMWVCRILENHKLRTRVERFAYRVSRLGWVGSRCKRMCE